MAAPIETAYAALAAGIAAALVEAAFLPATSALEIDPPGPFEPSGDETELQTAAALAKAETSARQRTMGAPAPRYIVERACVLELSVAGPEAAAGDRIAALSAAAVTVAALVAADPTLAGAAERFWLVSRADDELPPNGLSMTLTFRIRVRSGDPLGMTP